MKKIKLPSEMYIAYIYKDIKKSIFIRDVEVEFSDDELNKYTPGEIEVKSIIRACAEDIANNELMLDDISFISEEEILLVTFLRLK